MDGQFCVFGKLVCQTSEPTSLRSYCTYYTTVVTTLQDVVPKCIMLFLVTKTQNDISRQLYTILKDGSAADFCRVSRNPV